MAQQQRGGISLVVEGLQQFLAGLQQGNQAMQQFGQQAQQTAQATNAGFAQSAQAVSLFGQQVQMTGEVTNANLAEMVNQLKYNVSDQAIEALTGLTSRAQDILQTVTQWKIPAPELDAAGWNRVAELMRDFTILDRKGFEADFKAVSATVVAEQQKMADAAKDSAKRQTKSFDELTKDIQKYGVAITAAGAAGTALLVNTGLQASRIEELAILLEVTRSNAAQLAKDEGNLATAAKLNATEVAKQVQGIRDLHLSGVVANETVAQLIRYNLDYTKATELARLAQDAATFAMQDSSQAVEGLIHGISTLQPRILRTYGIMVNLTEAYRVYAKENDLLATGLTQSQRQQAAFNAVLAQAPRIAGAYEAAMGTASKQIRSLQTDMVNLKEEFGEEFTPILDTTVGGLRNLLDGLTNLSDPWQSFIAYAGGSASVLASVTGSAILLLPKLKALSTGFTTLAGAIGLSSGALSVFLLGIPAIIGAIAAIQRAEDVRQEEATAIAMATDNYKEYIVKLEDASLEAYAFSEELYDLIKAKQATDEAFATDQTEEIQSRAEDLKTTLDNLATVNFDDPSQQMAAYITLLGDLLPTLDDLQLKIIATGGTLREWAKDENWPSKQANEFDNTMKELAQTLIDNRAQEQNEIGALRNLADRWREQEKEIFDTDERLGHINVNIANLVPLVKRLDVSLAAVNWSASRKEIADYIDEQERVAEAFDDIANEFDKAQSSLVDATVRRSRAIEDLDISFQQKSEDAWIQYQRDLADSEGDLAKFHAGTLQELLDLDLDYLQDREDAWTKYQQDLVDAERDLQRDIEDANRDRAQDIADADRDYAQDRADALRDFNQDIEDNAREHTQKLLEIDLDYQQDGLDLQEEYQQKLAEIQNLGQQRLLELQLDYEEKASDTRLKYLRKALEDIEGGFYAESFETTLRELFLGLRDFGPGEIPNEFRDAYAQMLKDLEALREDQKWEEEDLSDDITREYDGRLAELEQWLLDEQAALDKAHEENVAKEQERFAEEQEERRRDYEQKLSDLQLAHGRELQEIDINNQRKLDDIQIQAERERAELALTYQRRLDDLAIEYDREKDLIGQKLEEQNQEAKRKYDEAIEDAKLWKRRERDEIGLEFDRTKADIEQDWEDAVTAARKKWELLPESLAAPYIKIKSDLRALLSGDPDSLENQWRDFVDNVWRIIQGGSPSRVMVDVGKSLISGLEKGLDGQNFSDIFTGNLDAQAFQANINAALPANMATVPGGMGGSTRNFSSTSNLTVNASYAHQSEASLRDDLAWYNSMMRAWGR